MENSDKYLDKVRNEGGVEVMKASAGSGKTFSLAREYIRLLLANRKEDHPYRHILAVTFTNKATAEMKSRIIAALDRLAKSPQDSHYREYLMEKCDFSSVKELSAESAKALTQILSDYGSFSVSTIDHFFQRVLRAFSREVGQFAEYQVELDRESLVGETVDRVLDSLTDSDALLKWLSSTSIESISNGEGYNLRPNLATFAEGYMSESYRDKAEALGLDRRKAFSEENLKKLREICSKISKNYDEGLKKAAGEALLKAEAEKKPDSYLVKRLKKIVDRGAEGFESCFEKVFWGKALERGALSDVEPYLGTALKVYNTALILKNQMSVFLVADALDTQFAALLKEKNVLSLDDTNSILRDIINKSNTPFVYEKVGVKYHHFLLDEFQDTSSTQWENFKPLLENSISEGCYNLIVGDVKQSIYRWRSARWDILDVKVQSELGDTVLHPLTDNRRSAREIVGFNNGFYSVLAGKMDAQLGAEVSGSAVAKEAEARSIQDIYSDVVQTPMCQLTVPGSVELTVCDSDKVIDYTVKAIEEAEARNFARKDIAVLVRSNRIGRIVASRLTELGMHVVSNDSLRIAGGWTVRTLIARLCRIDNPADAIKSYYADDFDPASLEPSQSLVDLSERILASLPEDKVNADTLYVLAFMDILRDYVARNGNSLHAFLKYWEEECLNKSISSPEGTDAITIITIHSAKGLDFPYVIIPQATSSRESWIDTRSFFWEAPNLEGTEFEKAEKALYSTGLSSKSRDTLFAENYLRELRMSYIDEANVWYVATTRPSQALHIVLPAPDAEILSHQPGEPWSNFSGVGGAFYQYFKDKAVSLPTEPGEEDVLEKYLIGTISNWEAPPEKSGLKPLPAELKYYPVSPSGRSARSQVRIKTDSADFFGSDGEATGVSASRRIRGTVLHKILETVIGPEDLDGSVLRAVRDGLLSEDEAVGARERLRTGIQFVADRGWFPGDPSKVLDEREILTPEGESLRPDRVVLKDDGVDIVDYKFAEEKTAYLKQVRTYAALYRAIGYTNVRAYLWFVDKNEIITVE